jgi:hypothetical protein
MEMKPLAEKEEEWNIRGAYARAQGFLFLGQERLAEALAAFRQAGDCFAQEGQTDSVIAMQSFQAYLLWRMGRGEEARALSAAAVAALEQTPGGEYVQDIYWHHSQILADDERRATNDQPSSFVVRHSSQFLEKAYRTVAEQAATLPDEDWREAFWDMPLHREIWAAWEAVRPRRVTVRLPRADAPQRGKLRDDQFVAVEWTPYQPQDEALEEKKARRQAQLARLLAEAAAQGARATIADLAAALDSSQPTIKRDLADLRASC